MGDDRQQSRPRQRGTASVVDRAGHRRIGPDPAGHHTPAQEEALAEQTQTDEEDIERAGDETTAREIETGEIPDAAGDGTPDS